MFDLIYRSGRRFRAYDLSSRYVRLPLSLPGAITNEEKGLFAPPENEEGFHQLAERICAGVYPLGPALDRGVAALSPW